MNMTEKLNSLLQIGQQIKVQFTYRTFLRCSSRFEVLGSTPVMSTKILPKSGGSSSSDYNISILFIESQNGRVGPPPY